MKTDELALRLAAAILLKAIDNYMIGMAGLRPSLRDRDLKKVREASLRYSQQLATMTIAAEALRAALYQDPDNPVL